MLVSPTGSGKTVMGRSLCSNFERILWITHRDELLRQTGACFDQRLVGYISPSFRPAPSRPIQIGTIQSILRRDVTPIAELVVFDECHHFMASDWKRIVESYPDAKFLGLSATPERADGLPMKEIFDFLVVAAQPSELLNNDPPLLVKAIVLSPDKYLDGALAQDPVDSYLLHGAVLDENHVPRRELGYRQAFMFCPRISIADEWAARLRSYGVTCRVICDETRKDLRQAYLADFRHHRIKVLLNVACLTEGIDIASAEVCVLARAFGSPGSMIQATGRVTRIAPFKESSLIIDLAGATRLHRDPLADRNWSLEGRTPGVGPSHEVEPCEYELKIAGEKLYVHSENGSLAEIAYKTLPLMSETVRVATSTKHTNCERCDRPLVGNEKRAGKCLKCIYETEKERILGARVQKRQEMSLVM